MKIGKFFDGQLMTESDRCRRFRWYIWQCALGVAFDAMRHCWVVTRWSVEQGKRWNRRILWWTNNRWRILIDAWKVDSQYKKKMMNLMPSCWLLIFCARCKEVIRNLLLTILRLCLLGIISFFPIKSKAVDRVLSCERQRSVQLLSSNKLQSNLRIFAVFQYIDILPKVAVAWIMSMAFSNLCIFWRLVNKKRHELIADCPTFCAQMFYFLKAANRLTIA